MRRMDTDLPHTATPGTRRNPPSNDGRSSPANLGVLLRSVCGLSAPVVESSGKGPGQDEADRMLSLK